jgi:hypothetical protein
MSFGMVLALPLTSKSAPPPPPCVVEDLNGNTDNPCSRNETHYGVLAPLYPGGPEVCTFIEQDERIPYDASKECVLTPYSYPEPTLPPAEPEPTPAETAPPPAEPPAAGASEEPPAAPAEPEPPRGPILQREE